MFDLKQKLKDLLISRQLAYRACFNPETPAGLKVLRDLARWCRADESTFKEDVRHHALLEGRREVWLRIISHVGMPTHKFLEKYGMGELDE